MSESGSRSRFLRSFLTSPRQVGAVLPTSRRTVRDTLSMAPVERARCVVEIGAGTGVYTREILARIGPEARLLAFEIDPNLARALETEIADPRLSVVNDSAAEVASHLGGEKADILVSAVPFTSLPKGLGREILEASRAALAPGGAMLVLQYSPLVESQLRRTFGSVRRRLSPLNLPPAFLYECRVDSNGTAPGS
jgi:phospholipid N-methyltransferase